MRFLHNTLKQEAGEGMKKNIKYCGTKITRVGTLIFLLLFFFPFSREKENAPPILLSPSRVSRGKGASGQEETVKK